MRALATLLCLVAAACAWAQAFTPFVVKDIRVEGLQRTEPGTVFSYLPVKVGETMTEEKAQQALRALFATGFFKDVRLDVENDVLIVYVEERPAIAQIDFSGVKEFEPDNLRKVLREMGIAEGRVFDRAVLETAEQELKRQYLSRGRYSAEVQTTVTPLERNRVGINFTVSEGAVAKIRSINLVGVQSFQEKALLDELALRTPGWLTWYTKQDQYSRQKLSADLETLRSYYLNRGYLDFTINSTQVSITPDKQDIYITVNVTEGEKYTVSEVQLSGQLLLPLEEMQKLVRMKPGDIYSRERLVESVKAINDRLGNDGYAFANANPVPRVDKEKRTVAFTIVVDPGRRVYVRRINIGGNTRTRDEVIRREMRQLEGAFFDASKIQLSKTRIDRTQYFKDINVETTPVAGTNDQVDVAFTVEEKPTGAVLLGAGFSSVEKLIVSGSVAQQNVFGSGKSISVNVNSGRVNQVYALSYFNPYWTIDGVSQGFDIYKRDTDASTLSVGAYVTKTIGGAVRFGYPLSETDAISFGLTGESVKLQTFSNSPFSYLAFVNQFGNDYTYGAGTVGISSDARDSSIQTTRGYVTRTALEIAAGDLQYYKMNVFYQWFYPLTRTMTLVLLSDLGYAKGFGEKPLPFFKNYYAGGWGSVRGYRPFSLGPQDLDGNALGGNRKIVGSAEVQFPMPGANQDKSLRLAAFVDGGQIFGQFEKFSVSELRYAGGLAVYWVSPFGPLKLSIAQPINNKEGLDRVQRVQFQFGNTF
jgi:outer membrane protein insertion porin family